MTRSAVARRSQAERSEITSTLVLDATIACLVELGYARTSTLVVHERAGVSRGALLHHFPSRAELMAAAVDHLARQILVSFDATALRHGDPVERGVRLLWSSFTSDLGIAAQELWTAARTDAELRIALLRHDADLNRQIRTTLGRAFGPDLASHPNFDTTMRVLIQAMRGAAAARVLHPDASARPDIDRWVSVANQLLAT
ncbi:MAG TPA: helix-turn-helix domain-containing protein [Mycobacteriales bacterium]|nr:helix-turn-helix domain-containing protein [Mycobacteriales bacterium]